MFSCWTFIIMNIYIDIYTLILSDAEARDSNCRRSNYQTSGFGSRVRVESVGSCPGKGPVLRWTTGRIHRSFVKMNWRAGTYSTGSGPIDTSWWARRSKRRKVRVRVRCSRTRARPEEYTPVPMDRGTRRCTTAPWSRPRASVRLCVLDAGSSARGISSDTLRETPTARIKGPGSGPWLELRCICATGRCGSSSTGTKQRWSSPNRAGERGVQS